jgi:hypothetical protein
MAFLLPSPAQVLDLPSLEKAVEQAPPDGIQDNAGLFQRHPAQRAAIAEKIGKLREERGFHLYVLIESVFVHGDPQTKATQLRDAWIPDGNGLVFVFEVDSRRLSVGQQLEQQLAEDGSILGIPSYVIAAILNQASTEARQQPMPPEAFMEVLISRVTDGFTQYFIRKDNPLPQGRTLRLGMVVIGTASALALIGMAAAWLLRRSERSGGGNFFFPETEVAERLGAPYGAGKISSRRFGKGAGER